MSTRHIFSSRTWGMIGMLVLAFHLCPASASVEITSFSVNERDGTINATIKVTSTSKADWSLNYQTVDGTASDETGDGDYVSVDDVLVFGEGETTHEVPIDVVEDFKIEGAENFELVAFNLQQLAASSSQGSAIGTDGEGGIAGIPGIITSGTISIEDDDTELFVAIQFDGGDATENLVTLGCSDGNVDGTGQAFNSQIAGDYPGGEARFEVLNFGPDQVLCHAFQSDGSPAGYTESPVGQCDSGFNISSDTCTLSNVYNLANFELSKAWIDDNPDPAEVNVTCSSGDLDDSGNSTANYSVGPTLPVTVNLSGFNSSGDVSGEDTTCTIVEMDGSDIYAALHTASGNSATSGENSSTGCGFGPLLHLDSNSCAIFNAYQLIFEGGFEAEN